MIADSSSYSRGNSQGLVYPAEVIKHEVESKRMLMVLDFFGESVGQASEAPQVHPHGEILPLDVTGRDMVPVGVANDGSCHRSDALRWTVARFILTGLVTVHFDEHRVVNFGAEGIFNGIKINTVSVRGELNP